jgi:hypothetical protein
MILAALWLTLAADQPLPFSHKTHAEAAKLACKDCHTMPGIGERATLPATAKCMACHTAIKTDSPHIAKLADWHKEKRPVPWVRVYEIPGFVFFSHKVHMEAGATCEKCHGPVAEREVLTKEVKHDMGTCMTCHRENKAPNDCEYCHQRRN